MEKGSKFGRDQQEESWQNAEVDALYKLDNAGVRVPKAYGCFDGVLLMELITDDEGQVAPRLNDVSMTAELAVDDHAMVMKYVMLMLCAGVVDGGGWLRVDGVAVDIIYRDLDRVQSVWADCRQGRFSVEIQGGHPLGFWSHAYAGEVALGMILNERTTEIAELQAACTMYPEPLATALVARLWESAFSVSIARKATSRVDVTYVAGCLFRAAGVMAQSMHGHAHRWLINEKGAIAGAADLGAAPVDFVERVHAAFELLAPNESRLSSACDIMQALVDDVAHKTG